MFRMTVRDHFMIAHSFKGATFGPAQAMHGATYIVDATFFRQTLDADGVIADIALASQVLNTVLSDYNLKNLDDMAAFTGVNTTTEFLAQHIADRLAAAINAGELGPSALGIDRLRVTLHESHIASAAYERALSE